MPPHILRSLQQLEAADMLRGLPPTDRDLIDFSSNDYLGLGRQNSSPLHITGAGGARLLTGNAQAHVDLEAHCAEHFRSPAALLYNAGYLANLGLLGCVARRGDAYIYDEQVHASMKDGMRLSPAERYSFRHNDLTDLERLLLRSKGNKFVLIESIYSMDGELPDLEAICALAQQHDAYVILDEAHATGILGAEGEGLAASLGLQEQVFARIMTFGKAVGRMGAVILGNQVLKDFLINRSRSWIYSTAMPAELAQDIQGALQQLRGMQAERGQLAQNAGDLRKKLGMKGDGHGSPIIPFLVPGNSAAREAAKKMQSAGYDLRPILAPTVASGTERLRIVLHSFNSPMEINGLATLLTNLK